jgi:hypothetical protein
MLLEGGLLERGQVVVLQPRRLAARLLAARVAGERGEARRRQTGEKPSPSIQNPPFSDVSSVVCLALRFGLILDMNSETTGHSNSGSNSACPEANDLVSHRLLELRTASRPRVLARAPGAEA